VVRVNASPVIRRTHPFAVGILGGMGPAAGADFVRLFVDACTELMQATGAPVTDQAYPEHWLAQVPVPDRSQALRQTTDLRSRPLEAMRQVAARLSALGVRTVAIACNTAHAWHASLQESFPDLEVIDGVREVARELARRGVREAGLLATEGTYSSGIYQAALEAAGIRCHVPQPAEQQVLMEGIYRGVKAGDMDLARRNFSGVARALAQRHALATLIMGCTEIPLALSGSPLLEGLQLIDPARAAARVLALRAYGVDESQSIWPAA
jgi:aspartate racemase